MTTKRPRISQAKVEKILAAAVATGLNPTSIIYNPDGGFEVRFGGEAAPEVKSGQGWEDV